MAYCSLFCLKSQCHVFPSDAVSSYLISLHGLTFFRNPSVISVSKSYVMCSNLMSAKTCQNWSFYTCQHAITTCFCVTLTACIPATLDLSLFFS